MARELVVAWVGRHRRDDWERLCAPYRERIGRHLAVREVAVLERARGGARERAAREGVALLAALPDACWLVALDRRGRALSSEELARWLANLIERWPHSIVFAIGSDIGLGPAILEAARERLSLGPLTLPHELTRLVLYEQLVRALSISAGMKYHRGPL
jgi:23S rRNA (pseudouridine1915-N3)-methyltransferase